MISSTPRLREGAVAVSPVDQRLRIAAAIGGTAAPYADVHLFRSTDGGLHWAAMGKLTKRLGDRTVIGHWDPVLAFDRQGRAYLAVVAATAESKWTIAVYRSADHGVTWSAVDIATPAVTRNDKPWIAIDNSGGQFDGAIHVVWFQLHNNLGLGYTVSRDAGQTWAPVRSIPSVGCPQIATGIDGDVYIAHLVDFGSYSVIRSSDSGVTFGEPTHISAYSSLPLQIVVDTSRSAYRGHLYVFTPGPDGVYFTRSTDRSATWSPLVRVSSSPGMLPSIDGDRITGEVALAWYQRDSTTRARFAASRSLDGGATLERARAGIFSAARLQAAGTPEPPARPARRRPVRH